MGLAVQLALQKSVVSADVSEEQECREFWLMMVNLEVV